ncbi:MAG: hypothetical protein VXZ82_03320 [Planctomycetota bacterium]|nr:hypothetical protein [Planctomycetota bacterium]
MKHLQWSPAMPARDFLLFFTNVKDCHRLERVKEYLPKQEQAAHQEIPKSQSYT